MVWQKLKCVFCFVLCQNPKEFVHRINNRKSLCSLKYIFRVYKPTSLVRILHLNHSNGCVLKFEFNDNNHCLFIRKPILCSDGSSTSISKIICIIRGNYFFISNVVCFNWTNLWQNYRVIYYFVIIFICGHNSYVI